MRRHRAAFRFLSKSSKSSSKTRHGPGRRARAALDGCGAGGEHTPPDFKRQCPNSSVSQPVSQPVSQSLPTQIARGSLRSQESGSLGRPRRMVGGIAGLFLALARSPDPIRSDPARRRARPKEANQRKPSSFGGSSFWTNPSPPPHFWPVQKEYNGEPGKASPFQFGL